MSAMHAPSRFQLSPRTRAALWVSLGALAVHLVPLFLPRKVPSVELNLAQLVPDARHRIPLLLPLLDNPRSTPAHLREAAQLVLPASSATARRFLAAAERLAPASEDNELLRARICRADGDDPCVVRALARAREMAPQDPRPDLLEAEFAELRGQPGDAVIALARAHAKAPDDVALGLRYAHALAAASRWDEAELVFAEVASTMPKGRARLEHGLLLLDGAEEERARREFELAVREDPNAAAAHYYLGVALFRTNAWRASEAELRKADHLDPSDFRSLALLCALQRENGRLDEAATTRGILDQRFPDKRAQFDEACPP